MKILTEEVNLTDVVKLAVNNDMVAVLKLKTLSGDQEMQLIATGHLQGNEAWIAYYKTTSTILTKYTNGKYWRYERHGNVSNSLAIKRNAILVTLNELGVPTTELQLTTSTLKRLRK